MRTDIKFFHVCKCLSALKMATIVFLVFFSAPKVQIVDERDAAVKEKFYKGGSTIELRCVVSRVVGSAPEYIIWHHEDRMLNYDTRRGGIR